MMMSDCNNVLTPWDVIGPILGFLGGLFSFAAGMRAYQSNCLRRFRVWLVDKKLKNMLEKNDALGGNCMFTIQVLKLYSPSEVDQGTALAQLLQFGDPRLIDILAARLGDRPALSSSARSMLLSSLKQLLIADVQQSR